MKDIGTAPSDSASVSDRAVVPAPIVGSADDRRWMRRALALSRRGWGHVSPNPLVGAVVVHDGQSVGEGWHARVGTSHAEAVALQHAGERARGATLYVTLEPCNHYGRTPPCTDAIVAAGVTRVVCAVRDPNPVAAGGLEALRAHGIEVQHGVMAEPVSELLAPFLFSARGGSRPWVTLKLAVSLDGALADHTRGPGWLTGSSSRRVVHRLRGGADAVAIGIGTALADDPLLTVRNVSAPRVPPVRVVFDRRARLPLKSQLIRSLPDAPVVLVVAAAARDAAEAERRETLSHRGVTLVPAVSLPEALTRLRHRGITHLLVEGGAELASAFVGTGMVDRLVMLQAPVILGGASLPAFGALPPRQVANALRWRVMARRVLGNDLMTTYAVSES